MFWENFTLLCDEKKVSPNAVCEALGLSNATATKWKNGSMPRNATLQAVANYFDVPIERLFSPEPTKKVPRINEELLDVILSDPTQNEFIQILPLLPDEDKKFLLKLAKSILKQQKE